MTADKYYRGLALRALVLVIGSYLVGRYDQHIRPHGTEWLQQQLAQAGVSHVSLVLFPALALTVAVVAIYRSTAPK